MQSCKVDVTLTLILNEKETKELYKKKFISPRSLDFLPDSYELESLPFLVETRLIHYFREMANKVEGAGVGHEKFQLARHYAQEICPAFVASCLY